MKVAWAFLLAAPMFSGCLDFDKDYRVVGVEATAWINGAYDFEDIEAAFKALGFEVSHEAMPQVTGSRGDMTLRSDHTSPMQVRNHPDTWTLYATYGWPKEMGNREWRDTAAEARHDGEPLWEDSRWHFDAFPKEGLGAGPRSMGRDGRPRRANQDRKPRRLRRTRDRLGPPLPS
jgi:hypothetical protein